MINIAPKSSITAKAVKKTFNETGTLLPSKDKIPRAKAISVAIGIPAPDCVTVPWFSIKYKPAGTIIPPSAAEMGNRAFLKLDNSPI